MKVNEIMSVKLIRSLSVLHVSKNLIDNMDIKLLRENFNNVMETSCIDQSLSLCKEHKVDVVIIDFCKNDEFGSSLIKEIRKVNSYQPIVVKTLDFDKEDLLELINLKINAFLINPDKEEFITKVYEEAMTYVSKKKNIERRIVLQSILDNQSGLILLTDFKKISYSSKSFLDFFSIQHHSELFNRYESILDMFIKHDDYLHGNTKEQLLDKFKNAKALKKVVLLVGKNFTPKAFHLHIDKVNGSLNDIYILSLTNISIMQEKNIEISQKAYIDGLTNIYNRNKFEETFSYEFKRNKRYKNNLCIAVLDIDYFKRFNDTYGHLIGDEVLILIAQEINKNIRKTDLFARWGGEEFVLLMPETDMENAKILCEKLRELVESIYHHEAGRVTCSFGITLLKEDDKNLKTIFKRCDNALYNAKANGRNRIEVL